MLRKILIPVAAFFGLLLTLVMVWQTSKQPPVQPLLFPPPHPPYRHYVAGEGIIESRYKNIDIGTAFGDLVTNVYVHVGQIVPQGTPLFKLDTRHFEAALYQAVMEEKAAETDYKNKCLQFSFYARLTDKGATSKRDYTNAYYAQQLAFRTLETARAKILVIKTDIERSLITAPCDGQVLQMNVRVGEYANVNPFNNQPLIVFGDTSSYHIRVDIDEADIWRVIPGAPAQAFIRGNAALSIPLKFVYREPYVIPKSSLTGADAERVDTRVLQLVYECPQDEHALCVGQIVDVYLEAQPSRTP